MDRFPGMGRRLRQRLRATGYWRDDRPDIARFCAEKGYRPQYIYAWLGDRVPSYENLIRLGRDLGALPEWVMFGTGPGARTEPVEAAAEARRAPRGQLIDFTRLRQVTSRLVRLEAELDAIFRAFPDFYFWLDADGTFLAWQGGRGSELHVAPDLMLGKRIADAFPPDAAQALERGARDAAASGGAVSVEFALGAASYETRFLPLGARPSAPRRLLMIVREITERKQAEDAANALARVSHELAGTLDPAEATERVVSAVLNLFRVRRAGLFELDPASGALVCVAVAGAGGDHNAWKGRVIPPGGSLSQRVIHERRPFWSHHVTAEPRRDLPAWLRERLAAEGHRSIVALPLVSRDEVLGTLTLASDSERVFTPVELRLLSGFADAAAVALRNARLYELSERRRQAAQALADVGRLVTRSLDPDVVAQRIADSVLALLGARASAILRVEPVFGDLLAIAVAGEATPGVARGLIVPAGTGVASRAVRERRPVVTQDLLGDPSLTISPALRGAFEESAHRAALAVPLLGRDGATGALVVRDRTGHRFDEEDVRLLQAFADHAALALENAQRFSETERSRAEALAAALHSGRRFESLVLGLTAIVWEADAETGRVLFVSDAAERILGYSLERWYTEPDFWLSHVHPEDGERIAATRGAGPSGDHALEYRMIAADGRVVWFSDFVHVVLHEDGRVRWLHGVMVDITESRLAAEATRALGEVGRLLAESADRDAVAGRIADSVRRVFGAWVATLYRMTPDAEGMVTVARARDASDEFDWNGFRPPGTGVLWLAMRERRAVFSPDILGDPRLSYPAEIRARLERGRIRAVLGVPLIVQGEVIGALAVGDRAGRSFDEREIRLAQAFADQAALALGKTAAT